MKNLIVILMVTIGLTSCQTDDTSYESTGKILGQDSTLCVCWCGGYVIEIDGKEQTYRFSEEFPVNNLDLSLENFPINIKLNWELIECNQIAITKIEGF